MDLCYVFLLSQLNLLQKLGHLVPWGGQLVILYSTCNQIRSPVRWTTREKYDWWVFILWAFYEVKVKFPSDRFTLTVGDSQSSLEKMLLASRSETNCPAGCFSASFYTLWPAGDLDLCMSLNYKCHSLLAINHERWGLFFSLKRFGCFSGLLENVWCNRACLAEIHRLYPGMPMI